MIRHPRLLALRSPAIAAVLFTLVLTGCSASDSTATAPTTLPPVQVDASPAVGASDASMSQPVSVSVVNGALLGATVTSEAGDPVGGTLRTDSAPGPFRLSTPPTAWRSGTPLVPLTTYRMHVDLADLQGRRLSRDWQFTTGNPPTVLHTRFSPDGQTAGVGMPIVLTLDHPVPKDRRAAFEQAITVTTTPAVQGAWHWFSSTSLHWRPADFWPAHTEVSVAAHLTRFDAGGGVWAIKDVNTHFTIGDSHVSTVDVGAHTMTVTNNGATVKTIPVSTGKDSTPTHGGIHVISDRQPTYVMDSSTNGVPANAPGGYRTTVHWSERISNSGEFVHAAPWSVGAQGESNVSHGCVNVSDADGQWFYDFSTVGDVVQVNGSPTQLAPDNGWGDWQIPWASWPN